MIGYFCKEAYIHNYPFQLMELDERNILKIHIRYVEQRRTTELSLAIYRNNEYFESEIKLGDTLISSIIP
jgi:ssRNA-specific RNase YbeY (16S rRNA maturation enzyme)